MKKHNLKQKLIIYMILTVLLITGLPCSNLGQVQALLNETFTSDEGYECMVDGGDSGFVYITGCSKEPKGDLIVPQTVRRNGVPYTVFGIGEDVYQNCTGYTGKLVIPETVVYIGKSAFEGCSGLTGTLTLPTNLQHLYTNAFCGCTGLTGTLTIPDSVTAVGSGAFKDCTGFTTLELPRGLIYIYNYAFEGCTGLSGTLTLPENLTKIYAYAFRNCSGFTGNLIFPAKLREIDKGAFQDCIGFNSLKFLSDSTSIDNEAFMGCSGLTGKLVLPGQITRIAESVFRDCSGLTGELSIPNSVTELDTAAFWGCTGLTGNVILPDKLTVLGASVFRECSGLTGTVTIPETVTTMKGFSVFENSGITKIINKSSTALWVSHEENYYWVDENDSSIRLEKLANGTAVRRPRAVYKFKDINSSDWYAYAVEYVYLRYIMNGTTEDTFHPNTLLTREQFTQVLYNHQNKPSVHISNPFPDVKKDWYTNAVLWAKENNIASGNGDGNFGVGQGITREALAVMLYHYAELNNYNVSIKSQSSVDRYVDGSSVSSWARQAMNWAIGQNVITGKGTNGQYEDYRLDPQGQATRAECAMMIMRMLANN